jgi:hypothetical protein
MKILFLNHRKSQCGVYEIGKRIFSLLDQNILPAIYQEVENINEYFNIVDTYSPDIIIYNYVGATMPFLNSFVVSNCVKIKHIGIIHDSFNFIPEVESIFDCWIVHDLTDKTPSTKKKFTTVRPICRFNRTKEIDFDNITIGTHGFPVSPWKMYDTIVEYVNYAFDKATINMNLPVATFGGTLEQAQNVANLCKSKITKPHIILNITHDYFETEEELIERLSTNTMNAYFYNDKVYNNLGIAGSADLAISSQSSLAVNSAYMYRHINTKLGSCTKDNIHEFLNNYKEVKKLYDEWSPERMTNDYKQMIESII